MFNEDLDIMKNALLFVDGRIRSRICPQNKIKIPKLTAQYKKKGETYQKDKIENELIWQENLRLKTRPP